jgi:predicted DNA-binding transcriptional regulator AlpA
MMNEREEMERSVLQLGHARMLWKLPLLSNEQVPLALGISLSAWYLLKRIDKAPPCVVIGGRCFWRTADVRAWVGELEAKKNPDYLVGVPGGRRD